MPIRSLPTCIVLAVLAMVLTACAPEPRTQDYPPIRFVELQRAALRDNPPPPVEVPLDEAWVADAGQTAITEEGLRWTAVGEKSGLRVPVEVDTRIYNAIELEMRVDRGHSCEIGWHSDVQANAIPLRERRPKRFMVSPGEVFEHYTFVLATAPDIPWLGTVQELLIRPSIEPDAGAILRRVRFVHHPLPHAVQKALDAASLDVFQGTLAPVPFIVPPDATFEAHVGLAAEASYRSHAGVVRTFRAVLSTAAGEERVLAEVALDPVAHTEHRGWQPVRADLADLAGQEVALSLEIDRGERSAGGHAYWAAPMVTSRAPDPDAVPVVLISCDTLRADHLSCYGYGKTTSPFLDAWAAEEAVLFENPIVNETWTLPSHMTMFTGRHPKHHKVTKQADLAQDIPTLGAMLRGRGYVCGGFAGTQWWLAAPRGFGRGMDMYDLSKTQFRHVHETLPRMFTWLDEHPLHRRFLFFHNYDVHYKFAEDDESYPYDPGVEEFRVNMRAFDTAKLFQEPEMQGRNASAIVGGYRYGMYDFSPEEHAFLRAGYDDSILLVDDAIRQLIERLKAEGFYDEALIIVTADHGETLGDGDTLFDRRDYGHNGVYEELCRVPLIVKFPGGAFAGRRHAPMVQSADIFATILTEAGIDLPDGIDGQSLRAVLKEKAAPLDTAYVHHGENFAVRTNTWKLHRTLTSEQDTRKFFNLKNDPGERDNLFSQDPPEMEPLAEKLEDYFRPSVQGWNIQFAYPASGWQVGYAFTSDEPLTAAHEVNREGEFKAGWVRPNNVVYETVTVDPAPYHFVKPESERGSLRIALASPTPFRTVYPGSAAEPVQRFEVSLDPTEQRYPKPASLEPLDGPTVYIWHGPPMELETSQMKTTEEIEEELANIGYLE